MSLYKSDLKTPLFLWKISCFNEYLLLTRALKLVKLLKLKSMAFSFHFLEATDRG